jgi:hypothetical protein
LEDLYDLLEVAMYRSHNERLAMEREQREREQRGS